jgi:hypothetical protein
MAKEFIWLGVNEVLALASVALKNVPKAHI